MLRALIFDFDGTILDTEMPTFVAWQQTYARYGQKLMLEEYSAVIGSDYQQFDPRKTLELRSGQKLDWAKIDPERRQSCYKIIEQQEPLPGVRQLLIEARAHQVSCAIASSSPQDWVSKHLERLRLLDEFAALSCADETCPPKPSPEVYLRALEMLKVRATQAVAIEDSPNGVKAARKAGIKCLIVPNQLTRLLKFPPGESFLSSLETLRVADIFSSAGVCAQ